MEPGWLGIDPSTTDCGLALLLDGERKTWTCRLSTFWRVVYEIADMAGATPARPIVAAAECPDWAGRGTREVRVALRVMRETMSDICDRKRLKFEHIKYAPKDWQTAMLLKGVDTKIASMARAKSEGWAPQTHHEADAACILQYARIDKSEEYDRQTRNGAAWRARVEREHGVTRDIRDLRIHRS